MVFSFDNLDHGLLMTALRKHCQEPWILLYVERWLKAPMQNTEGQLQARDKGTPQGGVTLKGMSASRPIFTPSAKVVSFELSSMIKISTS